MLLFWEVLATVLVSRMFLIDDLKKVVGGYSFVLGMVIWVPFVFMGGEILGIVEMKRHYTNYFKGIAHFKELKSKLVTSMEYQEIQDTLDYITTNENEFHFA